MELKNFLIELNKYLKKKHLKLVMVRNFKKLPEHNIGNDLDLIIKSEELDIWLNTIKIFCDRNNLELFINYEYFYCTGIEIHGVNDKDGKVSLDLNSKLNWRGIDFYDSDQLVNDSILFNYPIYYAKYEFINCYVTFCHSFLYGGFIQEKYINEFRNCLSNNREEFRKLFQSIFTKKQTNFLFNKIESNDQRIPKYYANLIRLTVILRAFLKKPLRTSKKLALSFF